MSININPANKGKFTAKAHKAGKGVQAFAKQVLSEDSKASTKTKRQAIFAQNAKHWNHSGNHLKKFFDHRGR